MRWRLLVVAAVMSILLFGLVALAHSRSQGAALAQAPQPAVVAYDLSPGVAVTGVYPDADGGVWVQETNPMGLVRVTADAPSTGGVLPVQVVTTTLTGVITDAIIFGRPASPVITVPLDVVTRTVQTIAVSPGITGYAWFTDTETGWLSRPVSGTLDGVSGQWVHRAGVLEFLNPSTGLITSFESKALGHVPAVLNADVPNAVWGLAPNRLFLMEPVARTATVFLGTDVPVAVSHVTFQYGYYAVWFADPARYGVVELLYHPAHPADQIRSVYQLPGLRQADDLVRVSGSDPVKRWDPFARCDRTAAGENLWYLDRLHNRLGRLSPTTPYLVTEYNLPAPLALGGMGYDGEGLWFTLVGETAAFDPLTGILTRYQSVALPLVGVGGAAKWSGEANQVYQILNRYLLYFPGMRGND